jgi:hypothetical protein
MRHEYFDRIWSPAAGHIGDHKHFVGIWRITEMERFGPQAVDLLGPAQLKIMRRGNGRLIFGVVNADIEGRIDELDGMIFRFTFDGEDDADFICGRGYCVVEGDEMIGRIVLYRGDESGFKAKRIAKNVVMGSLLRCDENPVQGAHLPNKSLQPTATAVTPPAAQEVVSGVAVAEH